MILEAFPALVDLSSVWLSTLNVTTLMLMFPPASREMAKISIVKAVKVIKSRLNMLITWGSIFNWSKFLFFVQYFLGKR